MDWTNILVAACTVITTVIAVIAILGKKFDKIDEKFNKIDEKFEKNFAILNQIAQRLSKVEGYIEGRDVNLKLTGTEKKGE